MAMATAHGPAPFGALLKRHRLARGLSQEALAERAGISLRAVSDLERGLNRAPRKETLALLLAALQLEPAEQAALEAAASMVRAPLATASAAEAGPARSNLLPALTSFIGREQELAEVSRLLAATRLLTLTGTGGVGKTRLALQVAAGLLERYPDGLWLAELAPLADPTGVPQVVATAVGVREEAGQPLLATLRAALTQRRLLLVLDNCEHLLDACAAVAEALLRGCPGVRVLATSREALGLAGETVWRVPSLALPDARQLPPLEALARVEAVRLFVERARAGQPHFALTARNAALVAQICLRLDGIPLALELAAALLRGLSLAHLAGRLDDRFRLLTGGSRTALPRQQTLRATVDWSYGLLSVPEQFLFDRLSVFSGSFTLEAAEAVCAGEPIAAEAVLELLLQLVDRSLVTVEERAGDVERYRLLETLRQYGRERLAAGGDAATLAARHAAYYRALAEESEVALFGPQQAAWRDRLDAERMNIRQALRWALHVGAAQEGLQLAGALNVYWHQRGYMAEGVQCLAALLALPQAAARTTARAKALTCLAGMRRTTRLLDGAQAVGAETRGFVAEAVSIARETGDRWALVSALVLLGSWVGREDYPRGRAMLEECRALYRSLDHQPGVVHTYNQLGDIAWEQGDRVAAQRWWSEALRLARQAGDQLDIALQLGDLGMMAFHEGDYATARRQIAESLALYRALHLHNLVALTLGCLGAVARAQGDTALARSCYEEKLAFWRNIGDRTGIAATLAELGAVALQDGDQALAQAQFDEALTLRREIADRPRMATSLAHLGGLASAQGDQARAATLYREGLQLLRTTADRAATAACLEGLAQVAVAGGQLERATQLYGAAATQRRGTFVLHVWDDRVARDRRVAALRATLGDEAWATAWAQGEAMTPTEAIAAATDGASG